MFRIMKWAIRIVAVLLVIGSLSLTAGTLMFSSVALLASTAISTVTGAKTVYSKLTTKTKVQADKITKLSHNVAIKNHKLEYVNKKIATQTDELAKLGGKVKDLESNLAVKNKELKIAKNAMTTQDGEIAKLGGKVKDLESETIKTSNKLKTANSTITEQTDKIASLTKNNKTLELEIKNTPSAKLPTKLAQKKAIESTSNTVISKSLGMVSRNALSLPAQAIPFIGIAVIVGVTSLDIKASCDIVAELESLKKKLGLQIEDKTNEKEFCGITTKELGQSIKQAPAKSWEIAKQYVPDLPDFSPAWEKTKEWTSPTGWWGWITGEPNN